MFNFHYAVNKLDQNVQGHEKYLDTINKTP